MRLRVIALGTTAATLLLWLSSSFWLDAWHQSADMRRLERLSTLEEELLGLTRALAEERTLAFGAVDAAAGGRLVLSGAPSLDETLARLSVRRREVDAGLETLLGALDETLATASIATRLRALPDALAETGSRIERQRASLERDRRRFDRTAVGRGVPSPTAGGPVEALPAALRFNTSSGRLVRELHALQSGLRPEPYKLLPAIEGLRRARVVLRDFAEAESARAALRALAPVIDPDADVAAALDRALAEADTRARVATERLASLGDERRIDAHVRTDLESLHDDHRRLMSAWFPVAPSINAAPRRSALALDARIEAMIGETTGAVKAHGYRRLLIDTVLIAICFLIIVASLRLLADIHRQARRDRLTGLPNRLCLEERLARRLGRERGEREETALLMLDVDDFEAVNDTFGHEIGDELLRRIAARLSERLGDGGLLAALGGDEFAVVLWKVEDGARALELAERLRGVCERPFEIDGAALRVTLSAGVSVTGDHVHSAPGLLQRASIAMRQAKDAGKDRAHPFSLELAERSRARIALEADLRQAIARDQLELHYQPKVDARTGKVRGAEALLRWRHPEHGYVSPARFVPIAERCGLIVPIGTWVLREAIREAAGWSRLGLGGLGVSVNVSAEQIVGEGFAELVEEALAAGTLEPERLEIEVTESVAMLDVGLVVERLGRLRAGGVRIAIDDFGTDYSSLRYLEELPLDTLKIDRSFVVKLDRSDQGRSLVNTIVLMARSLGLETVAEGVETPEQLAKVTAIGCDQVQGYYHSKPVPAAELPGTVARIDAAATSEGARRAA